MESLRTVFTFRSVSALLLVITSVILLAFPMLNILGLEFSVVVAPVVTLLAGLAAVCVATRTADRPASPVRLFLGTLRTYWYLPVVPGLVALSNALFVTNCDLLGGIVYYTLIVPFGAAFGVALALAVRTFFPRSPRSAFVLLFALTLLHIPAVTFFGPQIYAFNPVVGYFPGVSYDSTHSVVVQLLAYRLTTVLLIGALVSLAGLPALPQQWRTSESARRILPAAAPWLLLLGAWFWSDELGFSSSLDRIRSELGGVIRTEHFLVLYPEGKLDEQEAVRLGEYHEFLYTGLSRTLRAGTPRTIISVLYENPAQKSRLVGGAGTNFTKPWLWQMHLLFDSRDRVLKHELVHVIAAEFGFPLIRIGLNSGFIEGLAVALERESYGMPLDRAAAAIADVRGSAEIAPVFSVTGFFRSHPSVSYTLAGSFCRYLIERYGIRRFKKAYRSGSFSVYGRTFAELEADWTASLRHVSLSGGERLKARFLFDRAPGFTEECYQFAGATLREARGALSAGEDSSATTLAEMVYRRTPSIEAANTLAQALLRTERWSEALGVLRDHQQTDPGRVYLPAMLTMGDALWALDSPAQARAMYEDLVRADLSDGWTEAASFRIAVLSRSGGDAGVRRSVVGAGSDSVRTSAIRERAIGSSDPVLWYALSRRLSTMDEEDELLPALQRAADIDVRFLRYAVKRRLSGIYRNRGAYEKAKAVLWEAQNYVDDAVRLRDLQEGIEWMTWLSDRSR